MNTAVFSEEMLRLSDAELLRIVSTERDSYLPAAVSAAEDEIRRRDLPLPYVEQIQQDNLAQRQEKNARANEPLKTGLKMLAFLEIIPFIFLILLVLVGRYRAKGNVRKADELGRWMGYGVGFWIGLLVLLAVLGRLQ